VKFLTTSTLAREANVSVDWVRKAVRRGDIPADQTESGIYIIRAIDAQRWIARRRRDAADAGLESGDRT
jgi:hypothetical protein